MLTILLVSAVFLLAYSNGANDNFKGVATLYGSGTLGYRAALLWATGATVLGSMLSVMFAATLAGAFAGKGIVPDELVNSPVLLLAVGTGGAVTIMTATVLGMPTSTTHALTGALVGAGVVMAPQAIGWGTLLTRFAQPLLLSPVIAVGLAAVLYLILRRIRLRLGIERTTCVWVRHRNAPVSVSTPAPAGAMAYTGSMPAPHLVLGTDATYGQRYEGTVVGVSAQRVVDVVHCASGAAVCFARAVNDTPKIAALLLAGGMLHETTTLALVALAMALGGLLNGRRVAETMSKHITDLNHGQGLTANLTTAGLVLIASRLGLPVSTTHVSCSSIFGIGLVNRSHHWKSIAQIGVAWITTLPLGFAVGAGVCWLL